MPKPKDHIDITLTSGTAKLFSVRFEGEDYPLIVHHRNLDDALLRSAHDIALMDDAELVARILWCTEVVLQGDVERGAVFVDPPSDELRNGDIAVPAELRQAPSMVLHGFDQHAKVTLYLGGEPAERVSIVKETLSEHEAFFRIEVRNDTGPVFKGTVHASRSKQAQ